MEREHGQDTDGQYEGGPGHRIGERYRVLGSLGHGGAALVYRVRDERLEREVALKTLKPLDDAGDKRTQLVRSSFEREFQVLQQLSHPRIVQVFDYGYDGDIPYYTMELLRGQTLSERLPVSIRELAVILCDVAACLALLHARRHVHRDITPRNIWCDADGRAKLLDFGAMINMGPVPALIGTPPYVPPEAFYQREVDGRADLFSLGAVAYRALSGHEAYPARELRGLPVVWRQGPPKLRARDDLPPGLRELVLSLLSLDRAGRPATATEVIERICAAVGLEPDRDQTHAQAYLVTPPLLGREPQLTVFRKAMLAAKRGQGQSLLLRGHSGLGHTRMLQHFTQEANLLGAVPLLADRGSVEDGDRGVLRKLCEDAIEQLPDSELGRAQPLSAVLGHLGPAVHAALGSPELAPLSGPGAGPRLVSTVVEFLAGIARRRTLLIMVDGLHQCAGLAAGLLEQLAPLSRGRRLILAVTHDNGQPLRTPGLAERLLEHGQLLELTPLDADEVERFTGALFAGAEHQRAVATWLQRVSEGVPGTCMALAQHLLDSGLAHYDAGRWHLPAYPQQHALPRDLHGVLESRIRALSPEACLLAQTLSLVYDDTRPDYQPQLQLTGDDLCQLLQAARDDVRRWLGELRDAGVVRPSDGEDMVAHRGLAELLRKQLPPERERRIRYALAEALKARDGEEITAVRHYQLAGEHERAVELLCARDGRMDRADFIDMRLQVMAEAYTTAIDYARARDLPRQQIRKLYDGFRMIASVYDWSLLGRLDDEMTLILQEAGLQHWDELAVLYPRDEVLEHCLQRAAPDAGPGEESDARKAARRLSAYATSLAIASGRAHDIAGLRRAEDLLSKLYGVTPSADLYRDVARQLLELVTGREPTGDFDALTQRFYTLTDSPLMVRLASAGVHAHTIAIHCAERGAARPNEVAEIFEANVPGLWLGAHMHWLGYGFRCNGAGVKQWEPRAIAVVPDDLWRRRGFLMAEARMHALTGDLLALKNVLKELDFVAEHFPGWRPFRDWAVGEYHLLRGVHEQAEVCLTRALSQVEAGEHAAWGYAHPALALVQARRGDHAGAVERARSGLVLCEALGLTAVVELDHLLVLAQGLTGLGEYDEATETLSRAASLCERRGLGGIHLGRLCEARLSHALARGQRADAESYLTELAGYFAESGIPRLSARHVRWAEAVRRGESGLHSEFAESTTRHTTELRAHAREWLSTCDDTSELTQRALSLLLEAAGAAAGALFLPAGAGGQLELAATVGQLAPEPVLLETAEQCLQQHTALDGDTELEGPNPGQSELVTHDERGPRPLLLLANDGEDSRVTGVVVLGAYDDSPQVATQLHTLAEEIAQALA